MSLVAEGGGSLLCSSSTVLLCGQLTHVVYTAQGKELMLLAVPDNRFVTLYTLHNFSLSDHHSISVPAGPASEHIVRPHFRFHLWSTVWLQE
jgi:hypothetical protein